MGEVDELNSFVGLLLTRDVPERLRAALVAIQHDLFDLGGELSVPGRVAITPQHASRLEARLDRLNAGLPALKEFVLPGGTPSAALAHLARTVCRRAERRTVALARTEAVNPESVKYLNRLSDLLFVLARSLNARAGKPDVLWQPGKTVGRD